MKYDSAGAFKAINRVSFTIKRCLGPILVKVSGFLGEEIMRFKRFCKKLREVREIKISAILKSKIFFSSVYVTFSSPSDFLFFCVISQSHIKNRHLNHFNSMLL